MAVSWVEKKVTHSMDVKTRATGRRMAWCWGQAATEASHMDERRTLSATTSSTAPSREALTGRYANPRV